MRRFRFPLRSVAVIRAHAELRAREAFAAAVHAYVGAEATLAAWRARLAGLEAVLFAGRSGSFRAAEAAAQFRAYRAECAEAMAAESALNAARALMEQRRLEYLEANRRLKVMDRLESRARAVHQAAELRVEQAVLDEFAGQRAFHRS